MSSGLFAKLMRRWKQFRSRPMLSLASDVAMIAIVFLIVHAWNTRSLPKGDMAALNLPTLAGENQAIQGAATGIGIVYFFAPWCFYCRNSIDNLDALVDKGTIAWARAVALDYDSREDVRGFVNETGLRQPVFLGNRETARQWGIRAYPTYFVINSEGRIASRSVGYSTFIGLWARARFAD